MRSVRGLPATPQNDSWFHRQRAQKSHTGAWIEATCVIVAASTSLEETVGRVIQAQGTFPGVFRFYWALTCRLGPDD